MQLQVEERTIADSSSHLRLETPLNGDPLFGGRWFRYLTIRDEKVFETGNICDTCP